MAALPFRTQQCLVSAIGALLFLPVYLFWGGIFSFEFGVRQSIWAWSFDLTACWFQAFGILASFVRPRWAAYWMLVSVCLSVLIALGWAAETAHSVAGIPRILAQWLHSAPGLFKPAVAFWVGPLFLAFLLLWRVPREESEID